MILPKKKKNNYFAEMERIAASASAHAEAFYELTKNGGLASPAKNINVREMLQELTESLQKEYFTPLEREDILMLASCLVTLCEKTQELFCFASDSNLCCFSREMTSLSSFLYEAIENIRLFVKDLEDFPKTKDFHTFFETQQQLVDKFKTAFSEAYKAFLLQSRPYAVTISLHAVLERLRECMDCCREFSDFARYTLLKNS